MATMLAAKFVKRHGITREKWKTREKISQYRAILKLHARDKKLQTKNAVKLKKKISRNLKDLQDDVLEYRKIVKDVVTGDKRLLRASLQSNKDFQILLQDADPTEAYRAVFQDYNLKRKQLDKLLNRKEQIRLRVCVVKAEYEKLSARLSENEISPTETQQQHRQQLLISRYQIALAKRNAAKNISEAFVEILAVLRKDSMYYDGVLKALKTDQREQNRMTMRTAVIGQLAMETLDDVRLKYKKIARDVWINMKERERSLDVTRRKVDDIWACAKSLVRIDSETNIAKKKKDKSVDIDAKLAQEIKDLEDVFDKMKGMLKVQTYEELLIRLREQVKKRQNLTHLYDRNMKERDFIKNTKNHAEKMLQNLNHSMVSSTTRYKTDKKEMHEKMQSEKQRQIDNKNMIIARGELLMTIRAALQSLSSVLVCIPADKTAIARLKPVRKGSKRASKESRTSKTSRIEQEIKRVEEPEKETEEKTKDSKKKSMCDDPVETEGLAVLEQVTLKAITLFHMTDFELPAEKQEIAQDHYDTYVAQYQSKLKFGEGEEEESGMDFEHEIADQGVPTRADIKKKSKHIVELSTKVD